MLHRLFAGLLLTLALASAQVVFPNGATSQQPNASANRYPVSGAVVNSVTGAPIPRALVRLQGMESAQTFTSDDGHFEFKDVLEGMATLSPQRPGFQASARTGFQQIKVSSSTSSIQLKLAPQSSLRGRVVNTDGEPIEGIQVQVYRQNIVNGYKQWQPANSVNTDETGSYELDDLAPGSYLLHTSGHGMFMGRASIVVDGRHFPDLYPPQYYPNAPDRSGAQLIQIQPGADAQADFSLRAVPSYTASGVVTNSRFASIDCETADGEVVSGAIRFNRDGQFTLTQLPAGSCILHARTGGGQRSSEESGYAEVPLTIGSSDITGLQLSLEPLADIPVMISGNNDTADPANPGANVQLLSPDRPNFRGGGFMTRKGDAQVISNVAPGVYKVSVQVFGGVTCLGSATSGSTDLMRSDLTVSPGGAPAPITISLRKDCGTVTTKADGAAASDPVTVLAVLDGAPAQTKMGFGVGGNVQLAGLTPGDYIVYAAPDLNNFAYADPEVLKTASGQKVTVPPNGQATVLLKLMSSAGDSR